MAQRADEQTTGKATAFAQSPLYRLLRSRYFWDILFIATLMLAAILVSMRVLQERDNIWMRIHTTHPTQFAAALMSATGNRFTLPSPDAPEPVQSFLNMGRKTIPTEELRGPIPSMPPDAFALQHRYLLYAVAAWWKIFGFDWDLLKGYIYVAYALTAVIIYGLFRLGMRPLWACLGTFWFLRLPYVTMFLTSPRDFSKAPFILGLLFLLGWIIRQPRRPRTVLMLAAFSGLVLGVGFGFRQDVAVCLAPALAIFAFVPVSTPKRRWLLRPLATVLCAAVFGGVSWPVISGYLNTQSALPDAGMGLASYHTERMGIEPASYIRMRHLADMFMVVAIDTFGNRLFKDKPELSESLNNADWVRSQFILENVKTFPADFLVKGYGSILFILGGLFIPALAMLLIASRGLPRSMLMTLLILFFGAYPCLQFQDRHIFHFAFAPAWFRLFLIDAVLLCAWQFLRNTSRKEMLPKLRESFSWRSPGPRRAIVFGLLAVIGLAGPLYLLRAYQVYTLKGALAKYRAADLEEVPFSRQDLAEWVCFRPVSFAECACCPEDYGTWQVKSDYLMAQLSPNAQPRPFWFSYDTPRALDFSGAIHLKPCSNGNEALVRQFFPAYSVQVGSSPLEWSRFGGIALPKAFAGDFQGFYRVKNTQDFRLFLNITVPPENQDFVAYQRLPIQSPWEEAKHLKWRDSDLLIRKPAPDEYQQLLDARNAYFGGDLLTSANGYQQVLASGLRSPGTMMALAASLRELGQPEAALEACQQAIAMAPGLTQAYRLCQEILSAAKDAPAQADYWRKQVEEFPAAACAYRYLSEALANAGQSQPAAEAFQKGLSLNPALAPAQPGA